MHHNLSSAPHKRTHSKITLTGSLAVNLISVKGDFAMKRVYDNCCGIDVHKKLIVACFKQGSEQEVREFGATTRELLELCRWLKDGDCEMVAMESTA